MITPAYHIDKTGAVEDGSLRVLQELCVEKVVGEESFIEVNIQDFAPLFVLTVLANQIFWFAEHSNTETKLDGYVIGLVEICQVE